MDAPIGYGAQARSLPAGGYPGIAAKLVVIVAGGWWLVAQTSHQQLATSHHQTFFTSATSPVSDFLASPKSIDVFGL